MTLHPFSANGLLLQVAMLAGGIAPAGQAAELADLGLAPAQVRNLGDYPGHAGHVFRSQDANFLLGEQLYTIRHCVCTDQAHGGQVAPLEGYIGMPQPNACNWYHSGFLFISVNGRDVGTTPLSSMLVAESGKRAVLDLVWHAEQGPVRARFLGLPGHDCLFCEIAVEPKTTPSSLAVRLNCYPSFFTAAYHRDGARRVQTPQTRVEQGQRVTLPAREHWWCAYYDEVFDPAGGEGDGPCGLLMLPEEVGEIAFDPGGYAVGTRITCPPGVRRLRLAFWDFKGHGNAAAISGLRARADAVRQELNTLDFTPAAVQNFDIAGLRSDVERAMKSDAVRTALGSKTAEIQAWLERFATSGKEGQSPAGIAAQERLLQAIDKYQNFSWEVKLAELLSTL